VSHAIQQAEPVDDATMLQVIAGGDCSRLTPAQRTAYYRARCEAAGLDPRAQPFQFVRMNGKEVLYALKAASDQLAAKHGVRLEIVSQATDDGIRVVTVRAIARDGRQTDEIGAVPVKGLTGEALCNALMKAVTKAKRRAILSLTGLGMLDETEIDSISGAAPVEEIRVEPRVIAPVAHPTPAPVPKADPAPASPRRPYDDRNRGAGRRSNPQGDDGTRGRPVLTQHQPRNPMTIRLDVLCVAERTDKQGNPKAYFTKVGAAFQTKDGTGWSVMLDALPVSGKLLMKPPRENNGRDDMP
jgi:hypothetical protein